MNTQDRSNTLRSLVVEAIANPDFIHHSWYTEYHMEIVDKIANEACDLYPVADRDTVNDLVWIHDYEKVVEFAQEKNTELVATRELLAKAGYDGEEIGRFAELLNTMNAQENIAEAPIEVQIVSSADGASHNVGPFMTIYWYENPSKSIEELQQSNQKKIERDWNRKITIPEIRAAFEARRVMAEEVGGKLPDHYLS